MDWLTRNSISWTCFRLENCCLLLQWCVCVGGWRGLWSFALLCPMAFGFMVEIVSVNRVELDTIFVLCFRLLGWKGIQKKFRRILKTERTYGKKIVTWNSFWVLVYLPLSRGFFECFQKNNLYHKKQTQHQLKWNV